jgi:predicted nucleic acid-binding protein
MSIFYDAGVLVAADRNDRHTWADHRVRLELGLTPITTAPVVAQTSRSARQVQLRRFLRGCEIAAFTADQAHDVGALLGRSKTADVVDAHVVVVASERRALVVTSDDDDINRLSAQLPTPVTIEHV